MHQELEPPPQHFQGQASEDLRPRAVNWWKHQPHCLTFVSSISMDDCQYVVLHQSMMTFRSHLHFELHIAEALPQEAYEGDAGCSDGPDVLIQRHNSVAHCAHHPLQERIRILVTCGTRQTGPAGVCLH